MSKNQDLLVIGHTALDYIIKVEKFPNANTSTTIENMKNFHGGAAANVAMVGATMGLKTSLVSAVGGNFLDSDYHVKMKELKIDTDSMIVVKDEKTPTAFVVTDENQDQIFYFYWGAGKNFNHSKPPKTAINNTEAVHLATGSPQFNYNSSIIAKEENKIVSFDPGQDLHMYSNEKLEKVVKNCTILFGNHHEIKRILNSLATDINGLKDLGPKIVVKTCGKDGSIIYSDDGKIKIDPIYRPAIDPTGAGDSYRAGFLYSYLNGNPLESCAKFASSVSSFIVEKEGCQTNIPSYEEVKDRMNDFYSK
ncbi:MAG: carbohydrate kinase family protein [Methanobacteriaceae archaeon]|nr:carbohydrate kinase family protein [Candidatus Methanorudis spinitermitis]